MPIEVPNIDDIPNGTVTIDDPDNNGGILSLSGSDGGSYDLNRELKVVSYTIEIWDWKTGTYVADISKILTSELDIEWTLNDVESVDFSIDLIQFKKMCNLMGVDSTEVLTPYVHDIRIRRNGEYILGAQIVEANISINNNSPATIQIRCTGFLNLFKDQYISEAWSGYTYAQIARKLVQGAQSAENLTKNPTIDIDASYWLCPSGSMARTTTSSDVRSGDGALRITGSGWHGAGTNFNCPAGTKVKIRAYIKTSDSSGVYLREREYVTQSSNQVSIMNSAGTASYTLFEATYTTTFDNGYLYFEQTSSVPLYIDDVYIYPYDEYEDSLCNLNVSLGTDSASSIQDATRQRNYQLQNIKDALIDLTALEDDNFDFDFSPDRTFNCYSRKGSDKLDIEAVYPGNVHSMNISRSAANLANKLINIGSGIGDERIQVITSDNDSRLTYGTREKVITDSNVSLVETLEQKGNGLLKIYKDPTNLPKVVIRDGSINPSNVQVGDSILVRVEGDDYLGTINGVYRIYNYQVSVDEDAVETVTLSLELEGNI